MDILELSIPFDEVGISDENGAEFGLDVQMSDDDNPDTGEDRESKLAWYSAYDGTVENPSLMGTARLVDGGVE